MRLLLLTLLIADLLLAIAAMGWGGLPALYSSQVAFWTSLLVVAASFGSYRRMVRKRLEQGMVAPEERDLLDKMEDPYGLYEEEEERKPEDFREAIKEEKKRMKAERRSPVKVARDAVPSFSLWRVGAYGALVLGFFFLQNNGYLVIPVYLLSLGLPIVLSVGVLVSTGARDAG